jgi:hypothetical protein
MPDQADRSEETPLTDEQIARLADYYHERECSLNHTDMCGWHYENSPNYPQGRRWSHDAWARRVPSLLARDRQRLDDVRLILEGGQP